MVEIKQYLAPVMELLVKKQCKNISIYNDFHSMSFFEFSVLEKNIYQVLFLIRVTWLLISKVPRNKLQFLKEMHKHKLVYHPGREKLMQLITDKGCY